MNSEYKTEFENLKNKQKFEVFNEPNQMRLILNGSIKVHKEREAAD